MNWDTVQGSWKQFKGEVKQRWGKLTDSELTTIAGKRDELVGRLQKHYGYTKDEANRQIDDFTRGCCGPEKRDRDSRSGATH